MRIAYIDHSFHKETNSNAFLIILLRRVAVVDVFWDEAWRGGSSIDPATIERSGYDRILIFQAEETMRNFAGAGLSDRIVFVPMFDSSGSLGKSFWTNEIGHARVLCFCRRQYEELVRWGVAAFHVRYFPDPGDFPPVTTSILKGVFWWRRDIPSWSTVCSLSAELELRNMHVHLAPDPGCHIPGEDLQGALFPVTTSRWSAAGSEYRQAMKEASVYFAPRIVEGIGQSFLEAMAMGMIVVAPDRPTMNEYLTDGVTALLYEPAHPQPICSQEWGKLAEMARRSVARGFDEWKRGESALINWVLDGKDSPAAVESSGGESVVDFLVSGQGQARERTLTSLTLKTHKNWRMISSVEEIRGEAWVLQMNAGDTLYSPAVLEEILTQIPPSAKLVLSHYIQKSAGVEEWWRTFDPARILTRVGKEGADEEILRRWPNPQIRLFPPGFYSPSDEMDFPHTYHSDVFLAIVPERGPRPVLRRLRAAGACLIRMGAPAPVVHKMLKAEVRRVCAGYRDAGWKTFLRWVLADPAMPAFLCLELWRPIRFYGVRGGLIRLKDVLARFIFSRGKTA